MFGWFLRKRVKFLEDETKKSFSVVKKDIGDVGKWIKHLDNQNKQLFKTIEELKDDLSTVRDDFFELKGDSFEGVKKTKTKQVFKKLPVLDKQTAVESVQKSVQTAVQTGNFYDNLRGLSANERLLVMTLANNEMKLSYEDLALLLGKERSTIRGQINSIKQKSEGLIEEMIENSGKKRIFVPDFVKNNLAKYGKIRSSRK